jgi:hypothetical protein
LPVPARNRRCVHADLPGGGAATQRGKASMTARVLGYWN